MDVFRGTDFSDFAARRKEHIRSEIAAEQPDRLLGMDENDYISYLESKYRLEPIVFDMGQRVATAREVHVAAERFPQNFNVYSGHSYPKQAITIYIPFTGDEALFQVKPSQWIMRTMRVATSNQKISFEVIDFWGDGTRAGTEIKSACDFLNDQAKNSERDVSHWNGNLKHQISEMVQARKQECLRNKNSLAAIGIPLMSTASVPATFTVPVKVKRMEQPKPSAPAGTFSPDPTMSESDYAKIIEILSETGQALERTPSVHATQSEEGIRDYLLVSLSTHYQNASGETFRQKGKTDLLVPHKDGALFVAEIKVWTGPKSFQDAIDQLLSYLTWRDSKSALIVLVRQPGFSEVLSQIPTLVKSHSKWSSNVSEGTSQARFEYRMSLPQDVSRKVKLSVLLFHLPDVPVKRARRKGTKES
jgi:hypothetical protein